MTCLGSRLHVQDSLLESSGGLVSRYVLEYKYPKSEPNWGYGTYISIKNNYLVSSPILAVRFKSRLHVEETVRGYPFGFVVCQPKSSKPDIHKLKVPGLGLWV